MLTAAISFCAPSFANTLTADLSDLWYDEKESGWGVNVTQQREVIFMTFFIYGADGRAAWYTGQTTQTGQNSQGALIFSGQMFEFRGPYFANFSIRRLLSAAVSEPLLLRPFWTLARCRTPLTVYL